ncbi:hypothetical protein INS49_004540 [Diaporthe citri]|uniref:uncharacterized protein n=1 Tax=Diaporthe citri TaxID=83186 RepID=UPI001C80232C|nr:uncharacterized protein INS49_004540 [Diaporthe citri]KAG6354523.1 hypothetical protein INS49_004540 [Diaporthe citri]
MYDLTSSTWSTADDLSSTPSENGTNNEHPQSVPTGLSGEAYTREPPMSAAADNPWSKYDDTPGYADIRTFENPELNRR